MIRINNLSFKYKNSNKVLDNINLEINEGEFVSIIGKNGSGKSTFAKLISGLLKPTSGETLIDDLDTSKKDTFMEIRQRVGIVFQNPENQIIFNNVYDDIAFALKNLKVKDIDLRIKEALKKVKMDKYIFNNTYELSLGQKQRTVIAGILSINPKYIIFDEPTTMLDSEGKEDVYNLIIELKKQGYTIIYITNAVDEILMSDRIIILSEGKITSDFKKENIIENIDILKENNINLPKIVNIILELKNNKIDINLENWTMEELTKKLIEVYKNEKFS